MNHTSLSPAASSCACASRRGFLGSLLALGAGAFAAPSIAATGERHAHRIDTHHHLFPPSYVNALTKADQAPPIVIGWSAAKTLDEMEKSGVATSILSVTSPHVSIVEASRARALARECNEWSARLAADHPGKFGFFAMLPLPDVDGALLEMAHALDVLGADGICVLTSYGNRWLGDPSLTPVLAELDRRKGILYTHPSLADCCRNLVPDVPPTVIEFGTDTARSITNIVFSGAAAQFPDVRFIFSHGGGTLPFLTERLLKMPAVNPRLKERVPNGVLHELQRFHYDTAWAAHPMALGSLARLVPASQILFGSDYPYRSGQDQWQGLVDYGFTAAELDAIGRGNALRLMPRWSA